MEALITVALVGIACGADTPPPVKDGLWTIHGTTVESPADKKRQQTHSLCVNRASVSHPRSPVPTPGNPVSGADCKIVSKSSVQKGMRLETKCLVNGHPTRMKQTFVNLSDTEQTQTTEITYDPPTGGTAKSTTVLNMKYVGACPAGMAHGDIMGADGKISHPFSR